MLLGPCLLAGTAGAGDLGAREWQPDAAHECLVIPAVTSPTGYEFHAAFSRHWCLQGWAATSEIQLRESRPERWVTHVDILRNDALMLSVPMSPYVEQNMEKVAAGVVARIAAYLVQADLDAGSAGAPVPGEKQPGGERK